jgi:septal ring factor EnvC (AmiA/AmiB activator)
MHAELLNVSGLSSVAGEQRSVTLRRNASVFGPLCKDGVSPLAQHRQAGGDDLTEAREAQDKHPWDGHVSSDDAKDECSKLRHQIAEHERELASLKQQVAAQHKSLEHLAHTKCSCTLM